MLAGKVALCVGATSGIGKGIAYTLALLKADVAIVARNETLGGSVVADLRKINPNGHYEMIKCDASSMNSIRAACAEFNRKYDKVNYVVLSQGIATLEGRKETNEGIDTKMALHYYGRMLFVKELETKIKSSAKKEEVRIASILGVLTPYLNLKDLELKNDYSLSHAAGATGLYNNLAFDQLSHDYSGADYSHNVSFIHTAPGFIASSWGKDFPWFLRGVLDALKVFGKSIEQYGDEFVKNGLLSPQFGASHSQNTDATCAAATGDVVNSATCTATSSKAGFHVMTPECKEGSVTAMHTDENREIVWRHTNEVLAKALKN